MENYWVSCWSVIGLMFMIMGLFVVIGFIFGGKGFGDVFDICI